MDNKGQETHETKIKREKDQRNPLSNLITTLWKEEKIIYEDCD